MRGAALDAAPDAVDGDGVETHECRSDRNLYTEREIVMKIAIASTGTDPQSAVDLRFGRARYFLVVDTETHDWSVHDNAQNLNAAQGAGIQAGQQVSGLGVDAVISGNYGPKAFQVLNTAGIRAYRTDAGPVEEAVRKFNAGELTEASEANVAGHW